MSDAYVDVNGKLKINVMAAGKLKDVPYAQVGKRLIKNEMAASDFWDSK
jgi:hypothetical protein